MKWDEMKCTEKIIEQESASYERDPQIIDACKRG